MVARNLQDNPLGSTIVRSSRRRIVGVVGAGIAAAVAVAGPVAAPQARATTAPVAVSHLDRQTPTPTTVAVARGAAGAGSWTATSTGQVRPVAGAPDLGSVDGGVSRPVVGMAATPSGDGYWLVASDGGIFSFGDATFHGSTGALTLNRPIVGMATTPSGDGYWLVASDGGIFSFGDATFHGSTGALTLNRPIVGMATTPSGDGYWLVASDGGIFAFGDATFHGSTGALTLNRPIVGMATTPSGDGYWLVASDGGIFSFGDATFHGSLAGRGETVVGIATAAGADGYALATATGGVEAFPAPGSLGDEDAPASPIDAGAFMQTDDAGQPARFDPCQPIRYAVNLTGAPASAADDIEGALRRLSAATGLTFVDAGPTTETPSANRPPYQPDRYGDDWAPILIGWARPGPANPGLGAGVVGLGGSLAVGTPEGSWVYVTGQVVLNEEFASTYTGGFGPGLTSGETILHELGHVLGLAHSDDVTNIMFPTMTAHEGELGAGDLAALRQLGTEPGCRPAPEPWWLRTAAAAGTAAAGTAAPALTPLAR